MAKTTKEKTTSQVKSTPSKEPIDTSAFAFGRENYILLIASVVVLIIGYALMSGGKSTDPTIFNEEIFSFRRITLAPIIVLIGYAIGIYAIVKKSGLRNRMTIIESIILAIVEGITEFLPVSSTGHMIIASSLMGIAEDDFTKMFTVAIQFGAILSVVVLYFKRFFQTIDFYKKLFVAFIPAAVLGKLLDDFIDSLLGNVLVVGFTLLAGGVLLIFIDSLLKENKDVEKEEITYLRAFKIGLFQCIAMVPGVSRSAATIIGGLTQKLTRKTAAEFSFFLAVPTMFAATVYKMYKFYSGIETIGGGFTGDEIKLLIIGNVIAFIVAMLAIKSFIAYLTKYGFRIFGYYRIVVGIIIIVLVIMGVDLKVI